MNFNIRNNNQFTDYEQELYSLHSEKESPSLDETWDSMKISFKEIFGELSEDNDDFAFDEWHREMKCLAVYIYTNNFYQLSTLGKLHELMENFPGWFIELECYSDDGGEPELLGWVIVEKEIVTISETFLQDGNSKLSALGLNV